MKHFLKLFLVLLSTMLIASAYADVEVHISSGSTDGDGWYETIAGIENSGGTLGHRNYYTQTQTISTTAYGWDSLTNGSMIPYSPTYWFRSPLLSATYLSLGDDEVSSPISLGFDTTFDGTTYNTIRVSSNGFVTFADSTDSGLYAQNLPSSTTPNNLIAGWWEDLRPASGGGTGEIKYQVLGSAPDRVMVVEFDQVGHYGNNGAKVTFQIQIFED